MDGRKLCRTTQVYCFTSNEEGDFVVAVGTIASKDEHGKAIHSSYSDVWRFENGKMAELNAFIIEDNTNF